MDTYASLMLFVFLDICILYLTN